MKTVSVSYLEDVKSNEWMRQNLGTQEKSAFIRDAVAKKIAGLANFGKAKTSRKKK